LLVGQGARVEESRVIATFADTRKALGFGFDEL
jgi:hypothetical protein